MAERSALAKAFADAGLNRLHVFARAQLPPALQARLNTPAHYRQLLLLGHAGPQLWAHMTASSYAGPNPIDAYTLAAVDRILGDFLLPASDYQVLYPCQADASTQIDLQQLGTLAGWHFPAPFMLGIDAEFGPWWAYRALLLTASDFAPSPRVDRTHPCSGCAAPCVSACPAGACHADGSAFALNDCLRQRLRPHSVCAENCPARQACPLGSQYRYPDAQTAHSYRHSLTMLRSWTDRPA